MAGMAPVALGELVVGLVLAVGVEVEHALDEVLTEHLRAVLKQQVHEAVLTQAGKQEGEVCKMHRTHSFSTLTIDLSPMAVIYVPGDGRNRVH